MGGGVLILAPGAEFRAGYREMNPPGNGISNGDQDQDQDQEQTPGSVVGEQEKKARQGEAA